jgi:hypothetical protein
MVFMTDTSIGLKASWNGMSGGVPDSVHFGYKRKDAAWAPVFGNAGGCEKMAKTYGVKMPSFIGSIETSAGVRAAATAGVTAADGTTFAVRQFFATGRSADQLARRPQIQRAFLERAQAEINSFPVLTGSNLTDTDRASALVGSIDMLSDTNAIKIVGALPASVTTTTTNSFIASLDPTNQRATSGPEARRVLKAIVPYAQTTSPQALTDLQQAVSSAS